jgi:hypothetical protein
LPSLLNPCKLNSYIAAESQNLHNFPTLDSPSSKKRKRGKATNESKVAKELTEPKVASGGEKKNLQRHPWQKSKSPPRRKI